MKKKFLIITTLIFLTSVLGVFVVSSNVKAANVCNPDACPPTPTEKDTPATQKRIRMQISIPGVTETCMYHPDKKNLPDELKTCYHIPANLPAYITKLYRFALGAIAIMAVLMIMIGGLRWVFAAGNPGAITSARETITSAVAGLILALLSFVILNTINPSLTKLSMTLPGEIGKIEERGDLWCANFPYYYNQTQNQTYLFCEEGHWGETSPTNYCLGPGPSYNYMCGMKYEYGYEEGGPGGGQKVSLDGTCYGHWCVSAKACFVEMGYSYCEKPEDMCKGSGGDYCNRINLMINRNADNFASMSCSRADRIAAVDKCRWGETIYCPAGMERVNCLAGPEFDNSDKSGCWKFDGGQKVSIRIKWGGSVWTGGDTKRLYCNTNEEEYKYSNEESNVVCCSYRPAGATEYIFKLCHTTETSSWGCQAVTVDCNSVTSCTVGSAGYPSEDARNHDICGVCP